MATLCAAEHQLLAQSQCEACARHTCATYSSPMPRLAPMITHTRFGDATETSCCATIDAITGGGELRAMLQEFEIRKGINYANAASSGV